MWLHEGKHLLSELSFLTAISSILGLSNEKKIILWFSGKDKLHHKDELTDTRYPLAWIVE